MKKTKKTLSLIILSFPLILTGCFENVLDIKRKPLPVISDEEGPVSLTRILPATASSDAENATIRVSGVKSGDIIHLYKEASCTNEIASGTASSTSIDLTSSTLSLGTTTFAVRIESSPGNLSACSTATAQFTRVCPSTHGSFVQVPANAALGVSADFCVMKYEAREASGKPSSIPSGVPWDNINQSNARSACESLGANYHLISNEEWQTIARNIEDQSVNWDAGNKGATFLNRGWTAAIWTGDSFDLSSMASSSNASCLYAIEDAGNPGSGICGATGDFKHKRTSSLSNGEEVWDISGNAEEWVDFTMTCNGGSCTKPYKAGGPYSNWYSFSDLDTNTSGARARFFSVEPTYTMANFIGTYNANSIVDYEGVVRGGTYYNGGYGGIFTTIFYDKFSAFPNVSFRCTYRP